MRSNAPSSRHVIDRRITISNRDASPPFPDTSFVSVSGVSSVRPHPDHPPTKSTPVSTEARLNRAAELRRAATSRRLKQANASIVRGGTPRRTVLAAWQSATGLETPRDDAPSVPNDPKGVTSAAAVSPFRGPSLAHSDAHPSLRAPSPPSPVTESDGHPPHYPIIGRLSSPKSGVDPGITMRSVTPSRGEFLKLNDLSFVSPPTPTVQCRDFLVEAESVLKMSQLFLASAANADADAAILHRVLSAEPPHLLPVPSGLSRSAHHHRHTREITV